jgi:predicted house-cleaning noncanonical NTP pyrophosphatase (MazG superfamily)
MEITYSLSKEELIKFLIKHITKSRSFKRRLIILYSYFIIAFFLLFLINKQLCPFIIEIIVVCLFVKKVFILVTKVKIKIIFNSNKYSTYFCQTKLNISENHLLINKLYEEIFEWNSIKNIYMIDNYIIIITNLNHNIIIPSTAFNDLEDMHFFIDTILKATNLKLINNYPIDIRFYRSFTMEIEQKQKVGVGIFIISIIELIINSGKFVSFTICVLMENQVNSILPKLGYKALPSETYIMWVIISLITIISVILILLKSIIGILGYFMIYAVNTIYLIIQNGFTLVTLALILISFILPLFMAIFISKKRFNQGSAFKRSF